MSTQNSLCPWRMQVHHVRQETAGVRTIALINHDFYPYRAGQYALVRIGNSDQMRAYTLSSSPGLSQFITLTVRHIEGGLGSGWLTQQIKAGDTVWLSEAKGEFCCQPQAGQYLFLAAGSGITPVMSMCRWLHAHQPQTNVRLIYCVRSPQDVIFADELAAMHSWLQLTIVAENNPSADMESGRLDQQRLQQWVPDIASRTVMMCGPQPWMDIMENAARSLGVLHIHHERFTASPKASAVTSAQQFTIRRRLTAQEGHFPAGLTLLDAMERNKMAINFACRTGVCGCCKTRVVAGHYQTTSTATLSEEEIAQGYVLACSCHPQSNIEVN